MRRLGVLAGSFDPVHEGHIALAEEAKRRAGLDGVVLLPVARTARGDAEAPAQDRLILCGIAAEEKEWITVSQAGMTGSARRFSDFLGPLRREYPDSCFVRILGAEAAGMPEGRDGLPGEWVMMNAAEDAEAYSAKIRAMTAAYEDAPGLNRRVLCYMARQGLYQKDLLPRLSTMMNPRRFRHTLGVRREAVRLADLHGAPIQRCALAGLLHDCAKGMPVKEMDRVARENGLVDDENMYGSGALLHAPVGAYLARKEFGVEDEEILNAIRSHTIGRAGMTKMELVIFVADATEEGRESYEGLEEIRYLADRSLPAAALKSMQLTQDYLRSTGCPFFPAALRARAYLESILTENEKALLASVG